MEQWTLSYRAILNVHDKLTMLKRSISKHAMKTGALLSVFWLLTATNSLAFDKLTEAQAWIYDRSHLANTTDGQVLVYGYTGVDNDAPIADDKTTLSITAAHENDRRDVELEFLSGEQNLPLPPFSGFRGNPIIIAMLEHIAQNLSEQTGGGALYFRNRIRDALASEQVVLSKASIEYANKQLSSTVLTFSPFKADEYLGTHPIFRESEFTIQLSDDAPGGVISVQVSARAGDEVYERHLSLQ